jgi:hypothetical protein
VENEGVKMQDAKREDVGAAILPPGSVKQREVRISVFSVQVLVTKSGDPHQDLAG